ncbi:MAG: DNA polymerase III subunit alpha [Desulfobacterales bacterium]|nr:DNA polymerase III subunit alpha [Desulfobacterales bacterium]
MIPLTVRSHYSLMWGTDSVKQICRIAKQLGYKRLALTDTDNVYGLWPFLAACRCEEITPIVGAEVTDPRHNRRAVCLVENETGYHNLCRLLTRRHLDEAFDLEGAVAAHAEGLTVLTGSVDLLFSWHRAGVQVAAAMPRRPLPAGHRLRQTAKRLGAPLVATPGNFFLEPKDIGLHRLLRAIDGNTTVERLDPGSVAPPDAWLAASDEYTRRFAVCPEAMDCTYALADRLRFTGPKFGVVMPPWGKRKNPGIEDAYRCLREAAYAGAHKRYGGELSEPVVERLEHELQQIRAKQFCAYFLIVRDIVSRSPRTCGRGSGAASLVAYCLGITNVCPLKHNLYFERFLNPGRTDPPDIDVDFAWDERDDVLNAVLTQYRGHAAMVSNHVLFQPRMAVREVAKVYGLTAAEIGKVVKRLPWYWRSRDLDTDLLTRLKNRPETKALDFPSPWPEILRWAQRIIGIPRYLSVHPGGVVITPGPIDTYVPIERAAKGVPIIQWEKDGAEEAGLVKIDLLGNRSLGVIRDAVANVHANGIVFDETHWKPEDDFVTQEALSQGDTMGCFYIESPAMRLLQKKSGVGDFNHLVIHSSIIRPAANDFIREYIRRLHGGCWEPIHPLLTDVLTETFGIMVYQEDVSRAAVSVGGFTHAEADGLRKILSKKDRRQQLRDFYARFVSGAKSRGVSAEQIEEIWNMMMSFDGYSFCKPHSASYARVSFQAAYLKVHYPAEFMAAVISNQGGFYSTFAYVSEARRMGLEIQPPDVNKSDICWKGQGRGMRVGLLSIKGLTGQTRKRIISQRHARPYDSMRDFLTRVRPNDVEARALIHCGALDGMIAHGNRAVLMWELACRQTSRSIQPATDFLFAATPSATLPPPLPPENERDRLRREFAVLGFLCARHPLELFADTLKKMRMIKAVDLPRFIGKRVCLAAWLITGKVVSTKHGESMQFLTFEDETGIFETTFFPQTYRRFCHMMDRQHPYLLAGKVEQDWGAVTLTVDQVTLPLPEKYAINTVLNGAKKGPSCRVIPNF